jgi:serine/threonine protein kinase
MSTSATLSASDFTLLDEIGEGSYGKVFKALWHPTNTTVAVKIIPLDEDWLPHLTEVSMVIGLDHPSIVHYHGWFFNDRSLWLIMEYCEASLGDILSYLGALTELQISAVAHSCLSSLSYVHHLNRIHRDIKAGNLLVTAQGLVKVCDFGIAAQLDANMAQRASRIGTPYWMAPEVITAAGHNTKADIWSFGITLFELFTGFPPHHELPVGKAMLEIQRGPPPRAPPGASELFSTFIERVLVKDPVLRPTADSLLEDEFLNQAGGCQAEIIADIVREYRKNKEKKHHEMDLCGLIPPSVIDESSSNENLTDEATLLYGDGTVVLHDGTIVEWTPGQEGDDPLEGWTMKFLDKPNAPVKVGQSKIRSFSSFTEQDLRYLLDSVKQLTLAELADGKNREVVITHYDEVRVGIVEELRKKDSEIPIDFEKIE